MKWSHDKSSTYLTPYIGITILTIFPMLLLYILITVFITGDLYVFYHE